MTFAEQVRAARQALGYTAVDLAHIIDRHDSYVRRMEMSKPNRIVPNDREFVTLLAVALEVDPDALWVLAMHDRLALREPDILNTLKELGVM